MVTIGFPSLKRSVALSAMMCGALAGCASTQQQTSQAELPSAHTNVPHPNTTLTATGTAAPAVGGVAVAAISPNFIGPRQPQQTAMAKSGRVVPGSTNVAAASQQQMDAGRFGMPVASAANQGTAAIAAATGAPAGSTSAAAAYAASDVPLMPSVVAIPMPNPARPGDAALTPVSSSSVAQSQPAIPMTSDVAAIQVAVPTPRPGSIPQAEVAFATPAQMGVPRYADNRMHYDFNFDSSGPTVVPAVMTTTNTANYDSDVPAEQKSYVSKLIQKYAKLYEIPESLIHRVVHRESRYNPKAYNRAGYFGLMQIKYNTAKSMGYEGPASGLLDAETNIKYAAKYLRGAWMTADSKAQNKEVNAVQLYARGYYYDAKRKGLTDVANGNY